MFEELGAVHLGHAHVGNDQIDLFAFKQLKAGAPAFREMEGVTLGAQESTQRGEDRRLVIDEKEDGNFGRIVHGWICALSNR